jgi:DNA-binding NtrC family response regulator
MPDSTKTGSDVVQIESQSPGQDSLRERVRGAARRIESQIILEALERHHWNRRRAADTLKISYRSLMYKMKSCNLRDDNTATGGELKDHRGG